MADTDEARERKTRALVLEAEGRWLRAAAQAFEQAIASLTVEPLYPSPLPGDGEAGFFRCSRVWVPDGNPTETFATQGRLLGEELVQRGIGGTSRVQFARLAPLEGETLGAVRARVTNRAHTIALAYVRLVRGVKISNKLSCVIRTFSATS